MLKNTASQKVGAQMVSATDGSAFTGSVTVSVTGDAGTQAPGSVGSGACTHEGNGYHTYAPAQAETNYALIAFTFTGTGAVPQTVQVYTEIVQQTADNNVILASGTHGLAALKTLIDALIATVGVAGAGLTAIWTMGTRTLTAFGFSTGLATQASVDVIDGNVDDIETLLALMDADLTDIKDKTDLLTFDGGNRLEIDIKTIADVPVQGTGVLGDEWRPV